jgi:hypothetical protein
MVVTLMSLQLNRDNSESRGLVSFVLTQYPDQISLNFIAEIPNETKWELAK